MRRRKEERERETERRGEQRAACPPLPQPLPTPSSFSLPPQALTRWGGALLELAHFCQGGEAYDKIHQVRIGRERESGVSLCLLACPQAHALNPRARSPSPPPSPLPPAHPTRPDRLSPLPPPHPKQAISKFNAALAIDPVKHDALWCLGNAFTSQGFLTADGEAAGALFAKAAGCFERAVEADPGSEVYKKALEMTSKAPALHAELQKQLAASAAGGGGGGMGMGGGGGGGGRGGGGGFAPPNVTMDDLDKEMEEYAAAAKAAAAGDKAGE